MSNDDDTTPPSGVEEAIPAPAPTPTDADKSASMMRTPIPSDREQTWILMKRNFRNDRKKRPLLFARLFLGPCMWMLYTIAYLINSQGFEVPAYQDVNGFRLFPGEPLPPTSDQIYLAGSNATQVNAVQEFLMASGQNVTSVSETNTTLFQSYCDDEVGTATPNSKTCVFLHKELQYTLLFGGGESVLPFDRALAGTQSMIQNSILQANGYETLYPVDMIQKVPEQPQARDGASEFFLLFPGTHQSIDRLIHLLSTIGCPFSYSPLTLVSFSRRHVVIGNVLLSSIHDCSTLNGKV